MKFMKLGSKPDLFQSEGSSVRFVSSELVTDVVVVVAGVKFYLHKFPLLSKSYRLQRLILQAGSDGTDEISLPDIPGGPMAFEMCAKFCYGMIVTLSAYNVVAARCAAEYLEMTEEVEKGNLIYKIEVFLNSSVLRSWKDSIVVLQSTKPLVPWSEELKIIGRCIDSIALKTSVDPSNVRWSYTYNKKLTASDHISEFQPKIHSVPRDWWVDDLNELDIDLYKRVMAVIKSRGSMSSDLIMEALKAYAMRWLPDSYDSLASEESMRRSKSLVETIICLLPTDNGSGFSCRFLLKLLKVVILVDAGEFLKEELMNRISKQLDKAPVKDLLIPSTQSGDTTYDVELVQSLVRRFMMKETGSRDGSYAECENRAGGLILGHVSLVSVGRLIDCYLVEIGSDPNLLLSSFVDLAQLLPDVARPTHDGLYTAIDIFLKEHPDLTKGEKKKICSLMDVKKLTPEACIHAAQNEQLPLRTVVQVLFFEQVRAAKSANGNSGSTRLTGEIEEDWAAAPTSSEHSNNTNKPLEKQLRSLKVEEDELRKREAKTSNSKENKSRGSGLLLPSRSRRIIDKFWVMGKLQNGENNRSSETSGSSQSPPASANPAAEAARTVKCSGSSSRQRRHSVS
ncbi:BTB/POZ domain-containing protein NPY1 [Apostasia shenzhenica]|uniref:BTB/POZ domain-containing protein NPY1 n=1 Tax=Apostasia shenzhenica TaxID=1088818 RepID=A0A2I0APY8_9ASPA|nr:BTB/POZ domain-containing protein NPY1 [Apostasia shenzhenica]